MKLYEATCTPDVYKVNLDGQPLPMRKDLRNHSPMWCS
jgi:hypothetical protein